MLSLLTLLACSDKDTSSEDVQSSGTFSILTYNIHGLPSEVTGDDTTSRIEQITPLLSEFDIVGVQEDWIEENRTIWVEGSGFEHIDIFAETLDEEKVYGSGLSLLSNHPHLSAKHVFYEGCNGYIDSASDCFASKGLQIVSTELGGEPVHLLNTHLEAGNNDVDSEIRSDQINTILAEATLLDGAIIAMGDFNLHPDDPIDMEMLQRLTDAGFSNTCWELECSEPNHIDQIWYRSGDALTLTLESWERPTHFVDVDGIDLSDHPPIVGMFEWER